MELNEYVVEAAALGGAFLGCGGGGWYPDGVATGKLAISVGAPRIVALADLAQDALIATVSAVGAPAAPDRFTLPVDFVTALRMLNDRLDGRIAGIISSENGGAASLNGWFQSALTGIPVVDAACNGRAHPTGVMGSMGLDTLPSYRSVQATAGGDPAKGRRVELLVEGSLPACDRMVRQAAVESGGMVAVARNPISAAYVAENGAPGAISQAISLGELILRHRAEGGTAVAEALASTLGGQVLERGRVRGYALQTRGGYDVGHLLVGGVELTFWNEYMTADRGDQRVATFPDLIATLDAETGMPVITAELTEDRELLVVMAPKARLLLGAGVRRAESLASAEAAVGRPMSIYF